MAHLKTIEWIEDRVRMVDQTKLPVDLSYIYIDTIEEMYDAIKQLKIRGAPAIGVATAYGLYLSLKDFPETAGNEEFFQQLNKNAEYLASCRPTAVNLVWALERMKNCITACRNESSITEIKKKLLKEAKTIHDEDNRDCRAIGENGFEILKSFNNLLTHCNAGGLATSAYGTALSPIYVGAEKGKKFHVFADETRPLLQGARITAFELQQAGIDVTIICDSMAATVMAQKKVDAVIVGADRIAANGDVANKIGTYSVALGAKEHGVPFYVAAPFSTFDLSIKSGEDIPIEQRDAREITHGFGRQTGPDGVNVYNPAFDVTPNRFITALITEKKIIYPPFTEEIGRLAQTEK